MGNSQQQNRQKPPEEPDPPRSPRRAGSIARLEPVQPTIVVPAPVNGIQWNPLAYAWANRYYKELTGTNIPRYANSDEERTIIANLNQMVDDQNFKPTRPPLTFGPRTLSIKYPLVGYKTVAIMDVSGILQIDVVALLQMQVSQIVCLGTTGQIIENAAEFKSGQQLCTSKVIVTGVQFLGDIRNVQRFVAGYQDGLIRLVSQFDKNFEYKVGHGIIETSYRKPGIGCVQGIHFFLQKEDALKYLKGGFAGIDLNAPMITAQIQDEPNKKRKMENNPPGGAPIYHQPIEELIINDEIIQIEGNNDVLSHCEICHEQKNSYVVIGECRHSFHGDCLKEYDFINNLCPICDQELY